MLPPDAGEAHHARATDARVVAAHAGAAPLSQMPVSQRIILQIDLSYRKIVRRAPIRVHFLEQIRRQWIRHRGHQFDCSDREASLERAGRPGDQLGRDLSESVIERGDSGGGVRLVELSALLKQTRSDDLAIIVQDPR